MYKATVRNDQSVVEEAAQETVEEMRTRSIECADQVNDVDETADEMERSLADPGETEGSKKMWKDPPAGRSSHSSSARHRRMARRRREPQFGRRLRSRR